MNLTDIIRIFKRGGYILISCSHPTNIIHEIYNKKHIRLCNYPKYIHQGKLDKVKGVIKSKCEYKGYDQIWYWYNNSHKHILKERELIDLLKK